LKKKTKKKKKKEEKKKNKLEVQVHDSLLRNVLIVRLFEEHEPKVLDARVHLLVPPVPRTLFVPNPQVAKQFVLLLFMLKI